MKKQHAIYAGLLLLGLGTANLAVAQYAGPGYPGSGAPPYAGPGYPDARAPYAGPGYPDPGAPYAGPGYAEPGAPDPVLPPYEIMSIVRSTGLAPVTRPMRRGRYYVLVAVDRVGRQMRVVVDAQLGDVVNMRPAMADLARPNGMPGAAAASPDAAGATGPYGRYPSGDGALPLTPPRSIPDVRTPDVRTPNLRAATVPNVAPPQNRLAVPEPALPSPPPLPRPRPKMVLNEAAAPGQPAAIPPAPAATAPSPAPNGATDAAEPIE